MSFFKYLSAQYGLAILLIIFLYSCQQEFSIHPITTPCQSGGEPNLFIAPNGAAYLSWVEYENDTTDLLLFSKLEDGKWSTPSEIARGEDWFVNWADFPSLVAYSEEGKYLAAHWLQKSAAGTYDYDVRIAQSNDGGISWRPSFILHKDGIAAEHGFVSMVPVNKNRVFATWLDGRYTKTENGSDGHEHGHGNAMTLRAAYFDPEGNVHQERELDARICDCCQTSAALTSNGLIVAYRDRSEEEIRDISIVRQVDQDWTQPRRVYEDNWKIAGCPVNGPTIIANEEKVAIAWYTMAQDTPKVKVAISNDAGATFALPVRIDDGNPLGRVDLVFDNNEVIVSWLETKENLTEIRLARVTPKGKVGESITFQTTSPSRRSGFPIMERLKDGKLLLAWTEILDEELETTKIKTALVNL